MRFYLVYSLWDLIQEQVSGGMVITFENRSAKKSLLPGVFDPGLELKIASGSLPISDVNEHTLFKWQAPLLPLIESWLETVSSLSLSLSMFLVGCAGPSELRGSYPRHTGDSLWCLLLPTALAWQGGITARFRREAARDKVGVLSSCTLPQVLPCTACHPSAHLWVAKSTASGVFL